MSPFPLPENLPATEGDYVVERIVTAQPGELWRVGLWLGVGVGAGFGIIAATCWLVARALAWGLS